MAGLDEIAMLDETLGSFSGELTWRAKQNVGRSVDRAADWQSGFLRHLLQQPSSSSVLVLSNLFGLSPCL